MCRSTVNLAYRRLLPKRTRIQKIQQGTKNEGKRKEASEAMVDHAQQTSRGERVSAKKCNEVDEDNSLTHFTFSVLFVFYKREKVQIRHEPSWYEK